MDVLSQKCIPTAASRGGTGAGLGEEGVPEEAGSIL